MPVENVPVDPNAMQEELDKTNSKGKSEASGTPIYLLKKGITQLRVMPPLPGQQKFFREFREHAWSPGGKFRRDPCPSNLGAPCPVCDEGKRLYQSRDPESAKKSKNFRPRRQFIMNAVVLADPEGPQATRGVQVVRFGVKTKDQLVRLDRDFAGGWGDMTDLDKGFDVRIEKVGETMETTEYFVHPVPHKGPFSQVLQAIGVDFSQFNSSNLDELVPPTSYEQLQALLKEDFVPGFSNEPTVAETAPDTPEPAAAAPAVEAPAPAPAPAQHTVVVAPTVPTPFTTDEEN